jgi:hypothetical protein
VFVSEEGALFCQSLGLLCGFVLGKEVLQLPSIALVVVRKQHLEGFDHFKVVCCVDRLALWLCDTASRSVAPSTTSLRN